MEKGECESSGRNAMAGVDGQPFPASQDQDCRLFKG